MGLFDNGLMNSLAEKSSKVISDECRDQLDTLMAMLHRIAHLDCRQNDRAPVGMPVEVAGEEGAEGEGEGMTSEY